MSKQLDILFVQGNASSKIYQDLSRSYSAKEIPHWSGMLAQHCRSKGYSVQILDCEAEDIVAEKAGPIIKDINARLVIFPVYGQQPSASTQNMQGVHDILEELDWSCITLLIGLYPSANPRKCLIDEKCNFICQGEGPRTITSLIQTDLKSIDQLEKVPGLWFRNENYKKGILSIAGQESGVNGICFTKPESIISQEILHIELPGTSWDLLPMKKYRTSNWHALSNNNNKQPFAALYTSLGCPYGCEFCCINAPFGNANVENGFGKPSFRYWNTDFMITELEKLANMGIKNIKFVDEMFVLKTEHYVELCKKIIERGLSLNIWAYSRINTVKEGYLDLLKKAGINWLALGIESGDINVRKNVIKGSFDDIDIAKTVKTIQEYNINVIGNFIFGLPEDNNESMNNTFDLATELNCEFVNFYSTMAYPGSKLYLKALNDGIELPSTYTGFSQHSDDCFPLKSKYLTNVEILKFRDEAFLKYNTSEKYLNMIENKFGVDSRKKIEEMTKIKLKRKLFGDIN